MQSQHPVDQYFKKHLEEASIAPSNAVWERISAQTQPKKRSFYPYWIAASVVFLLGANAIWFFNQKQAVYQPRFIEVASFSSASDFENDSNLVALLQALDFEKQEVVVSQAKTNTIIRTPTTAVAELAVVAPVEKETEPANPDVVTPNKAEETKPVVEIIIPSLANQLKTPSRLNRKGFDNAAKGEAAQSEDAAKFNLLDYSLAQLNNVVHGSKVQPPKNTKELLPEPIDLAFNRVSALFKNNKNN